MKAFVYNICITLGILPVILWFGKNGGKYIWGSILSMLIGVCGVFVVNGKAANWYPITLCFSFLSDVYGEKSAMGYMKSGAAIFLYGLLFAILPENPEDDSIGSDEIRQCMWAITHGDEKLLTNTWKRE